MTLETALITAVSAVTGALVFLFRILLERVNECEKDRRDLRDEIEEVKTQVGELTGKADVLAHCPIPQCPWKR